MFYKSLIITLVFINIDSFLKISEFTVISFHPDGCCVGDKNPSSVYSNS